MSSALFVQYDVKTEKWPLRDTVNLIDYADISEMAIIE